MMFINPDRFGEGVFLNYVDTFNLLGGKIGARTRLRGSKKDRPYRVLLYMKLV